MVGTVVEPIVIKVDQIEQPRQPFHRALSREFVAEVLTDAPRYEARSGGDVRANLTRVGTGVLLEAEVAIPLSSDCRRCLRSVDTDLEVAFTLNMVARTGGPDRGEDADAEDAGQGDQAASHEEDEADEEPFDGEKFDLAPLIREQILLELPPIEPLCDEECRGLCVECGQVLDEGDCGHAQKQADPRWAALKNIKLER